MKVSELTGQDLAYWVAKANNPEDKNIIRRHYGNGPWRHDPSSEPFMRKFVTSKFGPEVPDVRMGAE